MTPVIGDDGLPVPLRTDGYCPECGHGEWLHRENRPTQNATFDDPVPCFAVVDRLYEEDAAGNNALVERHVYCGCKAYMSETTTPTLKEVAP